MSRSLFACSMAALFAVAPCATAHADDEDPAPRTVRIEIVKEDGAREDGVKAPARRSPARVIERWLHEKLGEQMTVAGDDPLGAMLAQWFGGGNDVPMADLRDALAAEGWNANSMQAWLMGEITRQGAHRSMLSGLVGRSFRPRTSDGSVFTWRGRMPGPQGMPWGARESRRGGMWGDGHRGWRTRRGMRGTRRGPRFGARGMRGWRRGGPQVRGPHAQGPWRERPAREGRGRHDGWQHDRPQVRTERRAFILWHDGRGWQRREIGPGETPFLGGLPHGAPDGAWRDIGPRREQAGPRGRRGPDGMRRGGPRPVPRSLRPRHVGPQDGVQDLEGLQEILRGLEGMTPREGGQPDLAQLRALLQKLRKQLGQGGMAIDADGPFGWLERFGAEDGDIPAPRRLKIRVHRQGDRAPQLEDIEVDEVEIERAPPKKRAPARDDER